MLLIIGAAATIEKIFHAKWVNQDKNAQVGDPECPTSVRDFCRQDRPLERQQKESLSDDVGTADIVLQRKAKGRKKSYSINSKEIRISWILLHIFNKPLNDFFKFRVFI